MAATRRAMRLTQAELATLLGIKIGRMKSIELGALDATDWIERVKSLYAPLTPKKED